MELLWWYLGGWGLCTIIFGVGYKLKYRGFADWKPSGGGGGSDDLPHIVVGMAWPMIFIAGGMMLAGIIVYKILNVVTDLIVKCVKWVTSVKIVR